MGDHKTLWSKQHKLWRAKDKWDILTFTKKSMQGLVALCELDNFANLTEQDRLQLYRRLFDEHPCLMAKEMHRPNFAKHICFEDIFRTDNAERVKWQNWVQVEVCESCRVDLDIPTK